MSKNRSSTFIDMKIVILSLMVFLSVPVANSSSETYKVVCYLSSWANYREGDGKFVIEDIDTSLCTHLIYAFTKLSENKITPGSPHLDLEENNGLGAYKRFNNLRRRRPGLKTLIAIGGWDEGSTKYSEMVSDSANRKTFVDSCLQFLLTYKFEGLEIHWQYPAHRGGKPEDKENFVLLIKELKDAFRPHGFLVTAAVSPIQQRIDAAYNIPALAEHLDFINLMTFNFHGGWDKYTGHNAPLYAAATDSDGKSNVDFAVRYWLSNGVPSEKLILGMPFFGRNFKLQDPKINGLGALAAGDGMAGPYITQPGYLGYNEICKLLKDDDGWNDAFDKDIQAPYAVKNKQWIGYDNPYSITLKVRYLKEKKLGGGMVWSIDSDDFHGNCQGERYPLLRAINFELNNPTGSTPDESEQEVSVATEIGQKSSSASDTSTIIRITTESSKSFITQRTTTSPKGFITQITTESPESSSAGNVVSSIFVIILTILVSVFRFHLY